MRQGTPPSRAAVPQPSQISTVSSSLVSQTAKPPPATVSHKNAKAAASKTPAVSSPLVFQTTQAGQYPGTVSQKTTKAAVTKIPAFSSQVRPNSGFHMAGSESTQGVFVNSREAAGELEDGGVIVEPPGEHSLAEQRTPNPKVLGIFPRMEAGPQLLT